MLSNVLRAGCSNAALSAATPLQSDFQGNDLPIPSSWTHPGPSWVRKAKLEKTKKTYANDAKGRPTNQSKAQQLEGKKAKIKQMPGNVIHFILHKSIKFYLHPNDVHAALPCWKASVPRDTRTLDHFGLDWDLDCAEDQYCHGRGHHGRTAIEFGYGACRFWW